MAADFVSPPGASAAKYIVLIGAYLPLSCFDMNQQRVSANFFHYRYETHLCFQVARYDATL